MLSHVNNSKAGREHHDYVAGNLFRVSIIPQGSITGFDILTEAIINVTGFRVAPQGAAVQQQFQVSKRNRPSTDIDTTQNVTISLSLNLNKDEQIYVYKKILELANRGFNQATGEMSKFADMVCDIVIENHGRTGIVYWSRTLKNAFIVDGFEGLGDVDYTSGEPLTLEVPFTADYYQENLI